MALALNKIILSGAGSNTPGAYFQAVTITTQDTATANTLVPAGAYVVFATANIAIQATRDNGSNWVTILAKNTSSPFVISDGVNVRFLNDAGANANITLLTVNGGESAPGTYND
jgi:hypothetical protein